MLYAFAAMLLFTACSSRDSAGDISLIPVSNGSDFGYIDGKGQFVINPQFVGATLFRNGMALVKTSGNKGQYGYIDEKGKYIITPAYQQATVFSEGLAFVVSDNEAPKAIDEKGKAKFTLQDAESARPFQESLAAFSSEIDGGASLRQGAITKLKWGFIDKNGAVKISPQYAAVGNFSDGKCAVMNDDGKWGYIDKDGKVVINNQFEVAEEFNNDKAIVASGGKAGVIDDKGSYIINPQFSNIIPDGDMYLISTGNKAGWADKEGKIIINPQFDNAMPFNGNSIAPASSDGNWGYVDKEGKFKINPQFDYALPFNGSTALVKSGNKYGFIDKDGKYKVNPQFDNVSNDLLIYLTNKNSLRSAMYNVVQTDFYNIGAITAKVKADITANGVRGVSVTSTVADVMSKFQKQQSDFYQYANQTNLINNEKIGRVASLNIIMLGNPYPQQQNSTNVYGNQYAPKVFNDQAILQGFLYNIVPQGKGYGKAPDIINAIEKDVFSGYAKDASSTDLQRVYTNTSQKIIVQQYGNSINIYVMPLSYGSSNQLDFNTK